LLDGGEDGRQVQGVADQGDHIDQLLAPLALYLRRLDRRERLPNSFGVEMVRGPLQHLGQLLHLGVAQAGPVRPAVENLEGLDFLLVVVEEQRSIRCRAFSSGVMGGHPRVLLLGHGVRVPDGRGCA
jgi:hypothetical protein